MQGFALRLSALQSVELTAVLAVVNKIGRCLLTTITYVYDFVTVNLGSVAWALEPASVRKKMTKKNPPGSGLMRGSSGFSFFPALRLSYAAQILVDSFIRATANIVAAQLRATSARDRKRRAARSRRSSCCARYRQPGAALRSSLARRREVRSRRASRECLPLS